MISTACAFELNETNDETLEINEIPIEEKQLAIDESDSIATNHTPSNYNEIQNSLENSEEGDTIILDGYYLFENTVTVNKSVTFQGINDATVDGDSKIRLFTVDASNVVFKNITFKNGYSNQGGAIYGSGPYIVKAFNCTFINNSANYGGAIYAGRVVNCTFINNSANRQGGAIASTHCYYCYFENNKCIEHFQLGYSGGAMFGGSAINCSFVNNSGLWGNAICRGSAENCSFINHTGASTIYYSDIVNCELINSTSLEGGSAKNCIFNNSSGMSGSSATNCLFINTIKRPVTGSFILNCTFVNNTDGSVSGGTAINCTFINNSAVSGGAIIGANAINCIFINNSAEYGGAIYGGSAVNCTFVDNSANCGGAVYFGGYSSFGPNDYVAKLFNCTFVNNSAIYGGAVSSYDTEYYVSGEALKTISITNCRFINNSATSDGGSIEISHRYRILNVTNSIFINSTTKNGTGGAIYSNDGTIDSSNFINCSSNQGGAVYTTSNVNITLSNFTNCISKDGNSYLRSTTPSAYNVTDCIFDEAPKDVSYHYYPTLTVNSLFIAKGDKEYLYANLTNICGPIVNKRINFEFNGRKFYATTNNEGIAQFDVNNYLTNLGETLIYLNFSGDDINYPAKTNTTVYINKYFGNLTVQVDGEFYNDTYLIFNLVNPRNVPISDAPLQLTFSNGEIINITTDFEGNAVYQIPFIPDTYNVSAIINEEFVFVNSVDVNNIAIKKLVGEIEVTPLNDNHTLMIRLYDADNPNAVYRNVKINLDVGPNPIVKEELFTNEQGYIVYDLLNFTKGTYSISVTVNGDYKDFFDYYLSNFIISNLLDSKINFTNNITFDFGEFGSTNFTVEGGKIGNVSVVNHTEAIISVSNNVITVLNLPVGKYTLLVETVPDDYHNPITQTLNITVNTVKSKVTFSTGVSFEYGGSASLIVKVDGGTVNGKSIQILNHPEAKLTFVKNMITVSGLNPGKYTLRVESIPDKDHKVGEGTVDITVRKATAVIKASKVTVALKKGTLWTIKLIDSKSKKPISNMKVTLKVYTGKKFKNVYLKTNSKGEANYQTKKLSKGNHKVVVSASHTGYNFNTLTSSIKVIKPTKLSYKVKKNIAKDGSSLSITVKKGKKPINGIKIKVKVYTGKKLTKTVTLKTKTNGKYKGVCGWGTNKISAGNHKIVIEPASIKYDGSKTLKMNIKKSAKKYPKWETKI